MQSRGPHRAVATPAGRLRPCPSGEGPPLLPAPALLVGCHVGEASSADGVEVPASCPSRSPGTSPQQDAGGSAGKAGGRDFWSDWLYWSSYARLSARLLWLAGRAVAGTRLAGTCRLLGSAPSLEPERNPGARSAASFLRPRGPAPLPPPPHLSGSSVLPAVSRSFSCTWWEA